MYADHNFENSVKRNWTVKEDFKLAELVGMHGPKRWPFIAQLMKNRTARQCRERWNIKLNPSIRKGSWSSEEDKKIVELYCVHGSCWSEISKSLHGRVENDIRNRFNAIQRECNRKGYKTMQEAIDADVLDKIFIDKNDVSTSSLKKAASDDKVDMESFSLKRMREWQTVNQDFDPNPQMRLREWHTDHQSFEQPKYNNSSLSEQLARIDDIGKLKLPSIGAIDSLCSKRHVFPFHASNLGSNCYLPVNNHFYPTTNFSIGNEYVNALNNYGELYSGTPQFNQFYISSRSASSFMV